MGIKVSIIKLTFNRKEYIAKSLQEYLRLGLPWVELIVVDNSNEVDNSHLFQNLNNKNITYLKQDQNVGVEARNVGIRQAKGDIIICLDDDVLGIHEEQINLIINLFDQDKQLGGICFKVLHPETKKNINWCHHCKVEDFANKVFLTNEITEGAVAFRKEALLKTDLYPKRYFISHEGPDLAIQLMNKGYTIIYSPTIEVTHWHTSVARADWRRYYYDTRNLIWLVIRHYSFFYAVRMLVVGLGAMFVYSLRDGYLRYWFKGILDALRQCSEVISEREVMNDYTKLILKKIDKQRPNVLYMIHKRLLSNTIKI
ncbi:MAG: glycosyltransferase family 2 protein [Candidatus Omnitrophica bacterium]|nr:glycosyltransferase family 2 protein [Candidatus Omnitrophota bacterium]